MKGKQTNGKVLFRRAIFGGLCKKDVVDFIETLEEENERTMISMMDESEKLHNQIKVLEKELSERPESDADTSDLHRKLLEAQSLRVNLEQQLTEEKKKNELLQSKVDQQSFRIASAGEAEYAKRVARIQQEATAIVVQQKRDAEIALATVKKGTSDLILQFKSSISDLEASLDRQTNDMQEKIDSLQFVLNEKDSELELRSSMMESASQELEALREEHATQQEKIRSLQNMLIEKDSEIEKQTNLANQKAREVIRLREKLVLQNGSTGITLFSEAEDELDEKPAFAAAYVPAEEDTMDELDRIFAQATESLATSERTANKRIVKFTKNVV